MKKISLKLFSIGNFKVKFSTILESRNEINNEINKAVNKYNINGNEYFTVNPYSILNIDISNSKKSNDYNPNYSFSLDKRLIFIFILKLERLYKAFTEESDLFFLNTYRENELTLNKEKGSKYTFTLDVLGQKQIQCSPCVISDQKTNKLYEGIYIAINSLSNITFLTYDQLLFLIIELKKINFYSLEIELINMYINYNKEKSKEIKIIDKDFISKPEEEIVDTKKHIHIDEPNVIPEI